MERSCFHGQGVAQARSNEMKGREMGVYRRYGIYAVPHAELAALGKGWLGWDLDAGLPHPHLPVAGLPRPLPDLTATATPYGLHATIKPPFRLAEGMTEDLLGRAMAQFAATAPPVVVQGLMLTDLDGFLALTPQGDVTALNVFAARAVRDLDPFRGNAPEAELTRRRAAGLSDAQEALLQRWGYPYVMDEFRFHITLTGRLTSAEATSTRAALAPLLVPILRAPYVIDDIALVGQMENGRFRLIHRYRLSG
jgi:2'-5' RNA ligase